MNTPMILVFTLAQASFVCFGQNAEQQPIVAKQEQTQAQAQLAGRKQAYNEWKEAEIAREAAAFYRGLSEIEKRYPIGTKEHAEAYMVYLSYFPWARSEPDIRELTKIHTAIRDIQKEKPSR